MGDGWEPRRFPVEISYIANCFQVTRRLDFLLNTATNSSAIKAVDSSETLIPLYARMVECSMTTTRMETGDDLVVEF
ncbi:hypothetical protein Tcan_01888 [Toxocara canis]|uniref:Uncharacterized protein n=1 Tax=Toxocara canis TaxID=6265 RepID=A0A0B2V4F5_TOXCA|nr:hypothetical protein Tcan_01888 [Toxocara canis]